MNSLVKNETAVVKDGGDTFKPLPEDFFLDRRVYGLNIARNQNELPTGPNRFYAVVDTFNNRVLWSYNLFTYNQALRKLFAENPGRTDIFAFGKTLAKKIHYIVRVS